MIALHAFDKIFRFSEMGFSHTKIKFSVKEVSEKIACFKQIWDVKYKYCP